MLGAAINYEHKYYSIDEKIVYKDGDTISTKINYGYKTAFANLYEYRKPNPRISTANYKESLKIALAAAEFSYAELPKYFKNILGVTGTLEVIPNFKKKYLVDMYKIEEQFIIPSAFGMDKRRE